MKRMLFVAALFMNSQLYSASSVPAQLSDDQWAAAEAELNSPCGFEDLDTVLELFAQNSTNQMQTDAILMAVEGMKKSGLSDDEIIKFVKAMTVNRHTKLKIAACVLVAGLVAAGGYYAWKTYNDTCVKLKELDELNKNLEAIKTSVNGCTLTLLNNHGYDSATKVNVLLNRFGVKLFWEGGKPVPLLSSK